MGGGNEARSAELRAGLKWFSPFKRVIPASGLHYRLPNTPALRI